MQAAIILACGEHANSILAALDECGVGDWTILSAIQARRKGFLENVPREHPGQCCFIYGCAEKSVMARALTLIAQDQSQGSICPECVAQTWEVKQALLANVALDPVCETVVDCATALNLEHDGKPYYFCCNQCLDRFLDRADFFIERQENANRINRRNGVAHHYVMK